MKSKVQKGTILEAPNLFFSGISHLIISKKKKKKKKKKNKKKKRKEKKRKEKRKKKSKLLKWQIDRKLSSLNLKYCRLKKIENFSEILRESRFVSSNIAKFDFTENLIPIQYTK